MHSAPHLVVSISGHGFGHVAQTAPILNALHELRPEVRYTVRSAAPLSHLRSRIRAPFTHLASEGDIGMVMSSALHVRTADSRAAYVAFHTDWQTRVDNEADLLRELGADMVFSNVGYLPLAGAQRQGIVNAALCSLNWSDIYSHYCGAATTSPSIDNEIARQIQSCYAQADAFLRTTPGMAMSDLKNLLTIAPIADIGMNRRDELNDHLGLSNQEKLVLVSMGGVTSRLPIENWPRIEGVRYLVQENWHVEHPDAIVFDALPFSFSDLLASSDVLLCKPGYGSFVEAASCGVPVLYVSRPDWPESPALIEWLQQYGLCREVMPHAMDSGDFTAELEQLWAAPSRAAVIPTGAIQAARWIAEKLA